MDETTIVTVYSVSLLCSRNHTTCRMIIHPVRAELSFHTPVSTHRSDLTDREFQKLHLNTQIGVRPPSSSSINPSMSTKPAQCQLPQKIPRQHA